MNNNITESFETLFTRAEDYGKTTIELVKLKAINISAEIASAIVTKLVILMTIFFIISCTTIGLALWIGDLLGKPSYYGFFVMSSLYIIIGLILYSFRHILIKTPISNSLITQMQTKTSYEKKEGN